MGLEIRCSQVPVLCLSHIPKWCALGRLLNLCEPEWLPQLSRQIFTEHRARHQKGAVQAPPAMELAVV